MRRGIVDWFRERVGVGQRGRSPGGAFPVHWPFLLGEVALWSFVVVVVTGLYLAFFFEPSLDTVVYDGPYEPLRGIPVSRAYASVLHISFVVPGGLLVRQVHHWAALVFGVAVVAHAARTFFHAAFRRPRELNWVIGVALAALTMGAGFTGIAIPHDLISGHTLRVGYSFLLSVPLAGPWLVQLVYGGEFPAQEMIWRLSLAHIVIIPLAMLALVAVHLLLVWRQGHTRAPHSTVTSVSRRARILTSAGLLAVVTAVLVGLGSTFQINPVWLYGPFEPAASALPSQPLWFLGWVEGALRLSPGLLVDVFGIAITGVFLIALFSLGVFLVLALWPFLDARLRREPRHPDLSHPPRSHPLLTALGAFGIALLGTLLLAASNDVQAQALNVPVVNMTWLYRVLVVVLPPTAGIVAWRAARDRAAVVSEVAERPEEADEVVGAGEGSPP